MTGTSESQPNYVVYVGDTWPQRRGWDGVVVQVGGGQIKVRFFDEPRFVRSCLPESLVSASSHAGNFWRRRRESSNLGYAPAIPYADRYRALVEN